MVLSNNNLTLYKIATTYISVATAFLCARYGLAQSANTVNSTLDSAYHSPFSGQALSDIFLGRNTVGPYVLAYTNVDSNSIVVMRGSAIQQQVVDYRVDTATGTITFTKQLKQGEIARVDYLTIPGKSKLNTAASIQTFKFNLIDLGSAMSFDAVLKPYSTLGNPSAGVTSNGMMILGLNSAMKLTSTSGVTSKIYLDANGGNILDHGGIQLNEISKLSIGQFSAGYSRAGSQFTASDASGISAGKEKLTAVGTLNAIHGFVASATFQQMTDIPSGGKGNTVTSIGEKLTGSLGGQTKLLVTRLETTTRGADSSSAVRTNTRFQLDDKLDKRTSVTALLDHNDSDVGGISTVNQTSSLTVKSQAKDNVLVTGSFQNKLLPTGNEDVTNLKVEAAASKTLKLSALVGDRYTSSASIRTREATMEFAPSRAVTLLSNLQLQTNGNMETVSKGVSGSVRPNKFVEVSGGVKLRDQFNQGVPDLNTSDTYDVKITLGSPKNIFKVSGGFTDNPDDGTGNVLRARNRSLNVQSTLGRVDIGGGVTLQEEYITLKSNQVVDLRFGWRMAKSTTFSSSFKGTQSLDQSLLGTDTYAMTLTHKIGSLFDLSISGTMTSYLTNGILQPNQDYRAEAKLGVKF